MKEKIHYTNGYAGKLNYHTICGKEIHSHSDVEGATISPQDVTCEDCLATDRWKDDNGHATGKTETDVKRRIYIESDILSASELSSAQRKVRYLHANDSVEYTDRVFSEVLDYAWHDLPKTWEAVKKADEIYTISSLMPIIGGDYSGAPVIFNGMCERAVNENVTGKSVYILTEFENVRWDMIDVALMKRAFAENSLFMFDENHDIVEIDVSTVEDES